MKLRINAFKIHLLTDKGPYGTLAKFNQGLNVIRAENTSGKSALLNGIFYALGLEILVGKRGIEATKPVLSQAGEYLGKDFKVLESYVELEIANSSEETITVRRYVKSAKDIRLIEVVNGALLTKPSKQNHKVNSYFVGVSGAAKREQGFHYYLANFFKLRLPDVKRFEGEDVPLYLECVAPLMLIEQLRGWSGIQATLPQSFGIRNVAKLAVEYILNLDVIENEKRRIQINEETNKLREDWHCVKEVMGQIAAQAGGRIVNVPDNPTGAIPDSPWISVSSDNSKWISVADKLVSQREQLASKDKSTVKGKPNYPQVERDLDSAQTELISAQAELSQVHYDIYGEASELEKLKNRAEFLKEDIQRNKDVKRLREYGADNSIQIVDKCPTCSQGIRDSLIPTIAAVMDLDENIAFLSAELEATTFLISNTTERLNRLGGVKIEKTKTVNALLAKVRNLRTDLTQNLNISTAEIRDQLHIQEDIAGLEALQENFETQVERLEELAGLWIENRARFAQLPKEYFSDGDKTKIQALSGKFAQNLQDFGYSSSGISHVKISQDNYRPICDDFEIAFGASASDNVRLIWAYTLSLLQTSSSTGGNHWGILVYDEPEQQRMRETSSDVLYSKIASMKTENFQVIIATSASKDIMKARLKDIPHKLLEFENRVIRPLGED